MIIKPVIKNNISVRVHPVGCKENVKRQIQVTKERGTFKGPKKVLIIGGSSGYGLASRITLGFGAGSDTINVSYEAPPKKGTKTGTAGWWNNVFFQQYAEKEGLNYKDFVGDAFSLEMKKNVVEYIKKEFGKIDLLVYSLASNKRKDPHTGELYESSLKTIGEKVEGYSLDIGEKKLIHQVMEPATEEEIRQTVKVMGGEDWQMWVDMLQEEDLLAPNFKTVSYTYIGSKATYPIYNEGTIGKAKEHLEQTAKKLKENLKTIDGDARISSSKAIVTKASAYIPIFPVYGAILYKVMKEEGTHEREIEQKNRLFRDMIYGENPIIDEQGRYRPDFIELDEKVQAKVERALQEATPETIEEYGDLEGFIEDFMKINGFCFDGVDYDKDIDLKEYEKIVLK
ncbi:MAG TPA: enoyl-[acyl-carrier-protein] reductase FabV [Eubacteriaceae bacterium]|nr:enoyl-[acyl-carrier-protein] reductase FabV [Eubacteriaceae bacterium]